MSVYALASVRAAVRLMVVAYPGITGVPVNVGESIGAYVVAAIEESSLVPTVVTSADNPL